MAYLLVLNGPRLDETVELDPGATLTLGSSSDAHIQVPDPDVASVHARVYPAEGRFWLQDLGQGYTLLNLDPVAGATQELYAHDVLVLGRTFFKFVIGPPVSRGATGPSHAVKAKEAEIERLRKRLTQEQGKTSKVRRDLAKAQDELDSIQDAHRAELEAVREELRADHAELREEMEALRAAHRAERESARVLSPLVFDPDPERERIEGEVRALRGRASELAATLSVSGGAS